MARRKKAYKKQVHSAQLWRQDPGDPLDKTDWTAPMWQAYVCRLITREARREAIDNEVPAEYRERVKSHIKTVWALKSKMRKRL